MHWKCMALPAWLATSARFISKWQAAYRQQLDRGNGVCFICRDKDIQGVWAGPICLITNPVIGLVQIPLQNHLSLLVVLCDSCIQKSFSFQQWSLPHIAIEGLSYSAWALLRLCAAFLDQDSKKSGYNQTLLALAVAKSQLLREGSSATLFIYGSLTAKLLLRLLRVRAAL